MKISSLQLFWIIVILEIGMTLLLTQSPAIAAAKQDAWLSFIVAGLAGVAITFVAGKLSLLYPNQTFLQYSQTILGKWLGKLIIIPYFIQLLSVMGVILRQSADFVQMTLFRNTPVVAIILLMIYLIVYVTYKGGIEGIGRCSEMIGPAIVVVTLITLILSITNIHWKYILPVYADSGLMSILNGSLSPISFLGESIIIMMLTSFTQDPKKSVSFSILGVGLVSIFVAIITIEVIMVFGPGLASRMWYPYFQMVGFISIMEFIQNIEIAVTIIWILSIFIKLSTFLFVTSYSIAELFHVKDWRKVIWFIAVALIPLSMFYPNFISASITFPQKFWLPFVVPINMVGIPMLLWIVGMIRKSKKDKQVASEVG